MSAASPVRRVIVVEARDLDTDERDLTQVRAVMPRDRSAQREQLAEIVREIHPAAELRSFAGGAATFLSSEHLVVAHYGERVAAGLSATPADTQGSLFSASPE